MRHETAMAAALKQAGVDTPAAELYKIATDLLRKGDGNPQRVVANFVNEVIDLELIYPLALAYLKDRAKDMKGGVTGQLISDSHTRSASASPHQRDGSGQSMRDTPNGIAAPSHFGRGGLAQSARDTHRSVGQPVREPSPLQKSASGSMRLKMAETVLDTFKVRDGRSIRHVYFRELPALTAENAIEASVLRQVQSCAANIDPNTQVGDLVKAADLEAMIAKAKKDMRVAA